MRLSGNKRTSLPAITGTLGLVTYILCVPPPNPSVLFLTCIYSKTIPSSTHTPKKSSLLGPPLSNRPCPIPAQDVWKPSGESFRLKSLAMLFSMCLFAFHREERANYFAFQFSEQHICKQEESPFCWKGTLDWLRDDSAHLNNVSEANPPPRPTHNKEIHYLVAQGLTSSS